MILEKLQRGLGRATATAASLAKTLIMSRRPSPRVAGDRGRIIVMGNGPSLRDVIDNQRPLLMSTPRMAVNLSALTPDFDALRPTHYILADIAFFVKEKSGKVPALWEKLAAIDWEMTLYLPAMARGMEEVKRLPANIRLRWYNLTPAEGWTPVTHWLYRTGLAMPRPRNVMVPAIMCAVRDGFSEIILTGADHNWSRTLWVTERNRVVSVQPHFYKDDDKELQRAEEIFRGVHIHDVYENYAVAFRSYHTLSRYLATTRARVLNATPGSFIDAFNRIDLSNLKNRTLPYEIRVQR